MVFGVIGEIDVYLGDIFVWRRMYGRRTSGSAGPNAGRSRCGTRAACSRRRSLSDRPDWHPNSLDPDKENRHVETHQVRDGQTRIIEFDGQLLGEVSSPPAQGPDGPNYGCTAPTPALRVGEGRCLRRRARPPLPRHHRHPPPLPRAPPWRRPVRRRWWFCERCGDQAMRDITKLLVEANRHWAIIAEDPAQIVDALYRRKNGARSMPRMSLDLLDEAGRRPDDPRLVPLRVRPLEAGRPNLYLPPSE